MPTYLFHTADNLRYIRETWGDLQTLRYPGTNRPWRQLFLTPTQREANNRAAALERAERHVTRAATGLQWLAAEPTTAVGASPSPGLDDVIDTIAATENTIFWLEDTARDILGFTRTCTRCRHDADTHNAGTTGHACRLCDCPEHRLGTRTPGEAGGRYETRGTHTLTIDPHAPWRRTFTPADREWVTEAAPAGSLHWACVWLESSLDVISAHEDFAQTLTDAIGTIRRRIAATVGEIEDGMTLKAPCISCRGIDEDSGQLMYTLRLRAKPDPVIMCVNPACQPTEALCGTWIRSRPAWPQREWDWLADRIREAEVGGQA